MSRKVIAGWLLCLAATPLALISADKKAAPAELNLTDLDGKKVHLKDYRGKTLVLNFWATWCGPCKDEMPMFVEVSKQWAAKGVTFIGASLDDKKTQKNIAGFLKQYQVDFPVWTGTSGDDLAKLGMGEAVPDTAFIDADGVIQLRVQGEIKRAELEERLEWMTGDRTKPSPKALQRNLP
jgi:thiol-disulfide isomerase/thioredoxin